MNSPPITELHYSSAPDVDSPPGPKSRQLVARQQEIESRAVLYPHDIPVAFESGKGATLKDVDGNIYLDLFSGIGVLNVGHANPYVTDAAIEQAKRLPHSLDFPTEPRLELIEKLDEIAPPGLNGHNRINFGGPTGSDAIESSIKLAKYMTGNNGMIAFRGSFHGETSGAFSLTSDTKYKRHYTPLLPEVEHVEYPYPFRQHGNTADLVEQSLESVKTLLGDRYGGMPNPAGIWVEPIQGEGGTVVPPDGFLPGLRDLCDEYQVPLIVDEVQTGLGRTGEWWGVNHYDVTPDIMPMGKALGSGFPLSGTMYSRALGEWEPGGHTGTFRGFNPAMRAAVRAIEYIQDHELLDHASSLGELMQEHFRELAGANSHIGDVRGKGLFIGIELVQTDGSPAPDLLNRIRTTCFNNGVLIWAGGRDDNVIRLLPPLVITPNQVQRAVQIIHDAIESETMTR